MVRARAVRMNGPVNIPGYAEIGITTNFSFLRGGSDPRAYVHQASELGIPVIGIADHNTLAGVVRAWKEIDNPEVKHKPNLRWHSPFSIRATAPPMAGSANCSPAASAATTSRGSRRASAI